jgi:uncharacterized phage-associated protein
MKLKKLLVPKFIHRDDLGCFEFHDVEILFDPSVNEISVFTFNQNNDDFFLSDKTIKKLSQSSALRFYNQRNKEILSQNKALSVQEMKGIKNFLGVNGADLGDLIGLDKSSVSRVLSEKQPIMHDMAMLLMERLKDEIQSPGYNQIVLKNLRASSIQIIPNDINVNVFSAAEYLIRFFEQQESALTNLKLQKLMYYAQGIALGSYSTKLFHEPILAWDHGPVIKDLYDKYKGNGSQPLSPNPNQSVEEITSNELVQKILDETISIYGVYTPWVLRNKTHNETPWLETKRDEQISDEKLISFFKKQLV